MPPRFPLLLDENKTCRLPCQSGATTFSSNSVLASKSSGRRREIRYVWSGQHAGLTLANSDPAASSIGKWCERQQSHQQRSREQILRESADRGGGCQRICSLMPLSPVEAAIVIFTAIAITTSSPSPPGGSRAQAKLTKQPPCRRAPKSLIHWVSAQGSSRRRAIAREACHQLCMRLRS